MSGRLATSRDPWVDRRVGSSVERIGYLSDSIPELFCRMTPPRGAHGFVVLCSDLLAARAGWSDQEERLRDRILRRGIGLLSFDYRGEGLSFLGGELSIETVTDDIVASVDIIDGDVAVAVVALGMSGALAEHEAARRGLPLAHWGREESGADFIRRLVQERLVRQMGFDPGDPSGLLDRVAADLVHDELALGGYLDVSGYRVSQELYLDLQSLPAQEWSRDLTVGFEPDAPAEAVAQWAEIQLGRK